MVGENGEVQVIDWGLAKYLAEKEVLPAAATQTDGSLAESNDPHTREGHGLGTPSFMPAEQANGNIEKMDRRSDVFGLGAILCVMLTGEPPYVGTTAVNAWQQACNADLAGAHARLEACGADAELIALARDCLSAEPNDRPDDASVVEERLTGYLASVQERLRKAELDRAAAQARAEEEERTRRVAEEARRLAEEKAKVEMQARLRIRRLLVGLVGSVGLFLLALLTVGIFAWRDRDARQQLLADTIDKALTAAMGGDLERADQAIEEAERAGASTGQVRMLRGQIALHRGKSAEAIRHLEQAVQLLPESVAARGMLAAAYADDGHWERYDRMIGEMELLTPSTPEDFLFKGYAEANLDPARGLETIKQAFDRRPMTGGIALLLRAEVRALVAQDSDNLEMASMALRDAEYARESLRDNPRPLWVSLNAHLVKAGVHKHHGEPEQRGLELVLAGKDADLLKPFAALPDAVVYRWLYFREMGKEEEVLEELGEASKNTEHIYVTFCYALTLYRRSQRGDLEEALRALQRRRETYNDRLLPFVLAEYDYHPDKHDWQARARQALEDFRARCQDGAAVMDAQAVLCLLGEKGDAVKASQKLQKEPARFYTLRREPIWRCLRYNAGDLSADDLLDGAKGSLWNECLAHHYIAMTHLADGDRIGAKKHFNQVIETRATLWGTYDMSWVFQARLKKDPTWPPWIPQRSPK
jgi:tetratricopeptide (TPR) repeat protein